MRSFSSLYMCLFIVKLVHRRVHSYIFVCVSLCVCLFALADVFLYDEGCA